MLTGQPIRVKTIASLILFCSCGRAPPSDFEATPRADQNLELLALSVSGAVVARQEIYGRVVRDVAAIRASHPEVQGIGYWSRDTGNSLYLRVDAATGAAIEQHTYHDWDGLNARWRLMDIQNMDASFETLFLQFRGIYDMAAVAREYAALRGVTFSEPDCFYALSAPNYLDGFPTICLTLDGNWYRYVFVGCLLGCISFQEFGFSTDSRGRIAFEAEWDPTTSTPLPDFIRRFGRRAGTSCSWR